MTALFDQEACDIPGEDFPAYVTRRRAHARRRDRHPLAAGVALGLVGALGIVGTVYVVRPQHPAVVRLHSSSATTLPPPVAPAPTTVPHVATTAAAPPTTAAAPVYDAQGHVVPAGTPGAVPAGAGPPAQIPGLDGSPVPNPIMTKVPGVVYTASAYYGAPQFGTLVGDHAGVSDPEGRSVSQYLVAMGLPAGTRVAVVGSTVVGYVPG